MKGTLTMRTVNLTTFAEACAADAIKLGVDPAALFTYRLDTVTAAFTLERAARRLRMASGVPASLALDVIYGHAITTACTSVNTNRRKFAALAVREYDEAKDALIAAAAALNEFLGKDVPDGLLTSL